MPIPWVSPRGLVLFCVLHLVPTRNGLLTPGTDFIPLGPQLIPPHFSPSHPSIHSPIHPPHHPFTDPPIHPTIHLSIHPSIHSTIHPSTYPSIHPSTQPSIYPTVHSPPTHSSIHPPIHLSIHPTIHPISEGGDSCCTLDRCMCILGTGQWMLRSGDGNGDPRVLTCQSLTPRDSDRHTPTQRGLHGPPRALGLPVRIQHVRLGRNPHQV